jgi:hypothetical protein
MGWVVSVTPRRRFTPGERTPVPIVQEAGWAPEPVWTQSPEEKSFRIWPGSNLDRPVVQLVARYYTAWATRLRELLVSILILLLIIIIIIRFFILTCWHNSYKSKLQSAQVYNTTADKATTATFTTTTTTTTVLLLVLLRIRTLINSTINKKTSYEELYRNLR